jgi:hypothetical protein
LDTVDSARNESSGSKTPTDGNHNSSSSTLQLANPERIMQTSGSPHSIVVERLSATHQDKKSLSSGQSPTASSSDSFYSMDLDADIHHGSPTESVVSMDIDRDVSGDLLGQLPGLFRILDLVGEQGSGGIGK